MRISKGDREFTENIRPSAHRRALIESVTESAEALLAIKTFARLRPFSFPSIVAVKEGQRRLPCVGLKWSPSRFPLHGRLDPLAQSPLAPPQILTHSAALRRVHINMLFSRVEPTHLI